MTAHREIFHAANLIVEIKGKNEFSPKEIFKVLKSAGSTHPITDVRPEIVRCCINSPQFHETSYEYFERIVKGKYKIL